MTRKFRLLISCLFFFTPFIAFSQEDWSLRQSKDGIKVYTKNLENSAFKAVKTVCTIDASLSRLTAVLLDIKNSKDWVYATKSCIILKQLSPSELLYYSEINVPWPATNRDFVVQLKVTQDENTKAVTIIGDNKPALLPVYKNIVRIPTSYSKWLITPLPNRQVQIEYILQVDPGGNIPAWLINLFATKGPYECFRNLRIQVKKDMYNNVQVPFIKD